MEGKLFKINTKKIVSLFVTVCILIMYFPFPDTVFAGVATASGGSVSNTAEFAAALGGQADISGNVITLKNDIDLQSAITIVQGIYALNLNGKTISCSNSGNMLNIDNNNVCLMITGNGTIISTFTAFDQQFAVNVNRGFVLLDGVNITAKVNGFNVNGGQAVIKNADIYSDGIPVSCATTNSSGGVYNSQLIINDGTFVSNDTVNCIALLSGLYADSGEIVVNGGTFINQARGTSGTSGTITNWNNTTSQQRLIINAGTFITSTNPGYGSFNNESLSSILGDNAHIYYRNPDGTKGSDATSHFGPMNTVNASFIVESGTTFPSYITGNDFIGGITGSGQGGSGGTGSGGSSDGETGSGLHGSVRYLTENGSPIPNTELVWNNGSTIYDLITDINGLYKTIASDVTSGMYQCTITIPDTELFAGSVGTSNIYVPYPGFEIGFIYNPPTGGADISGSITITDKTGNTLGSSDLMVRQPPSGSIKDSNGNFLPGSSVVFKNGDTIYTAITDSNGNYEFSGLINNGLYDVFVYIPFSNGSSNEIYSGKITCNGINDKLDFIYMAGSGGTGNESTLTGNTGANSGGTEITEPFHKIGDTLNYLTGSLKDSLGNSLPNAEITYSHGDNSYTAKTDSNGNYMINQPSGNGTYNLTVKIPSASGSDTTITFEGTVPIDGKDGNINLTYTPAVSGSDNATLTATDSSGNTIKDSSFLSKPNSGSGGDSGNEDSGSGGSGDGSGGDDSGSGDSGSGGSGDNDSGGGNTGNGNSGNGDSGGNDSGNLIPPSLDNNDTNNPTDDDKNKTNDTGGDTSNGSPYASPQTSDIVISLPLMSAAAATGVLCIIQAALNGNYDCLSFTEERKKRAIGKIISIGKTNKLLKYPAILLITVLLLIYHAFGKVTLKNTKNKVADI